MRVTPRSRLILRLQNAAAALLILATLGLAAWLSNQYRWQADLTFSGRNSLSPASTAFLKTLTQPLGFTIYTSTDAARWEGSEQLRLLKLYQAARPGTTIDFVNPSTNPDATRAEGISVDGELVIHYAGREEKLTQYHQFAVTNAIQRLARSTERYIAFLSGDGERDPRGHHNFDLGEFGKQLSAKGLRLEPLNLGNTSGVPQNTAVLVIAGPQADIYPGMVRMVRDYVKRGGNLLWLGDPGPLYGLEPLAQDLGVRFGKGTVVDPDSQRLYGIQDPRNVLVTQYETASPVTQGLNIATLFSTATSVTAAADSGWQADPFLQTREHSWLEAGPLDSNISFDPKRGDRAGPITIGLSLTRDLKEKDGNHQQRVIVTGDGDFLSDEFIGNPGELELGLNLVNWLAHDDSQIDVNARPAADVNLSLSRIAIMTIGVGFLFLLPALLLAAGILIRLRRRRR